VLGPEGELLFDLAGRAFGRGAWLHPLASCFLKRSVGADAGALAAAFRQAAGRRALGLIGAARRAHHLEAGSSAVSEAAARGRVELVVVATDARAAANQAFLEPLVATGKAQAFGTKAQFGACLARPETALLAVTDARFAREIRKAIEWTQLSEPKLASGRTARAMSSEVG
jgi:ribosomal protein L7Ae-like RNA K-turn-binding protein